jgi:hypothetical protein
MIVPDNEVVARETVVLRSQLAGLSDCPKGGNFSNGGDYSRGGNDSNSGRDDYGRSS